MAKKVLSMLMVLMLVQFENTALFSQDQKPTFERVYKDYSFIETAYLSKQFQYTQEELKTERKELLKKEKEEKTKIRKEFFGASKEKADYQKQLNETTKKINLIERKYEKTKEIEENGKKRQITVLDREALSQDPEYQEFEKQREKLECAVIEWEIKANSIVRKNRVEAVDRDYEIKNAQLDLLEKWPQEEEKIRQEKQSGKSEDRKFSDYKNIGLRDLGFGDQSDDIKMGEEYIKYLKDNNRLQEYDNPYIKAYVVGLIEFLAENSDVKVPINEDKIFLLDEKGPDGSRDINAWAVPGGFVAVTIGLLEETDNEAQTAGVLAHELAHVAARHGKRGMKKATILQAILMAVAIGTGNYWLYQGLGFGLSLVMLGVTREFETEADTLGMQYVWKAGYDPMGFMGFFEKMGKDKGSIRGKSFFRTHPVFLDRIVNIFREFNFLAPKDEYVTNTDAFLKMKAQLCVDQEKELEKKRELRERVGSSAPTLRKKERESEAEKEKTRENCGIQKPEDPKKKSFCDDPAIEQYKAEIRKERQEETAAPEKERLRIKRRKN